MANFWKRITGQARRERQWLEAPRFIPEQFRDLPAGSDDFIMAQEFADGEAKYLRGYTSAMKDEEGFWSIHNHVRNMRNDDGRDWQTGSSYLRTNDPLEVIDALRQIEASARRMKYIPIENAGETYTIFARRHGISFDHNGNPYRVTKKDTLSQSVLLNGRVLQDVFSEQSEDLSRFQNWEGLKSLLDIPPPEGFEKDRNIGPFTTAAMSILEDLDALKEIQGHHTSSTTYLKHLASMKIKHADAFQDEDMRVFANQLVKNSILYAFLNTGALLYQQMLHENAGSSRNILSHVKEFGAAAEHYAIACGFTVTQAGAMKNVISTGPNPDAKLPLRRFTDKYVDKSHIDFPLDPAPQDDQPSAVKHKMRFNKK